MGVGPSRSPLMRQARFVPSQNAVAMSDRTELQASPQRAAID